jgi:hypothetical protein
MVFRVKAFFRYSKGVVKWKARIHGKYFNTVSDPGFQSIKF